MLDLNAAVAETMKYGFPGVVIIVLSFVLYKLWKQGRADIAALEAKLEAAIEKKDQIQELRIAEGREVLNALNGTANVLDDVLKGIASIAQGAKQ